LGDKLLSAVEPLLLEFISRADGISTKGGSPGQGALVDYVEPDVLISRLKFDVPKEGRGQNGVMEMLERLLKNSVNTWHQGFMDKLYASTNAVGVASELILATLNTNVC